MMRLEPRKQRTIPWGWIVMVVLLTVSLVLAVVRGQVVTAIVIGALLVPALTFVVAWVGFGRGNNA